ncbi:MAG: TonB-dependent receptor plug domain-containing protein [Vicinamibacterales bacterium]
MRWAAAGRRIARFVVLAWIGVSVAGGVSMSAAEQNPDRFKGRSLASALSKLQRRGLKIIFSSELVRPDMIVSEEPRARRSPEILDELLAPHGLRSTPGPSGALLVVQAPATPKAPSGGAIEKKAPNAPLKPDAPPVYREHVDVRAGDSFARRDLPAVWESIERDQLHTSPEFSGDPLLPVARSAGVAATDGSGGLNVRGGAGRETKIILDGLELYEPYHLKDRGGPISIIDSQNIGEVGLLSGGFPAEYGGHMSAVVEMDTVVPSDHLEAGAAVSSGDTRMAARGVLGQRLRWLVSARHGDPSRLLAALGADPAYRPPFSDFFVKADHRPGDRTTLSLHVLGGDDEVEGGDNDEVLATVQEPGTLKSRHNQRYAWITVKRAFSPRLFSQTVLSAGLLTSDRYGSSSRVAEVRDARVTQVLGVKQDWLRQSGSHLFKWGLDFKQLRARYNYTSIPTDSNPIAIASAPAGADVGVYVADRLRISPELNVEVGLRWDRQTYTPDRNGSLSPRVNAVYAVGSRATLRLGWGYFYQPQKIHELQVEDGVDSFFPAERAEHRLVSYQHAFDGGVVLRLNGYQKRMSALNPRFENVLDPFSFFPEANGDRIMVVPETARADGLELVVRRRVVRTTGWWAAYSLARAEDEIDGGWVPRQWDRRQTLNVGVESRPTRQWDLVLAGSHHSGRPTTPVTAEGTIGVRNSRRSTAYRRVDARVSRSMSIRGSDLVASLTLTDAFDQGTLCCVADIGRLVTFGLAWRF